MLVSDARICPFPLGSMLEKSVVQCDSHSLAPDGRSVISRLVRMMLCISVITAAPACVARPEQTAAQPLVLPMGWNSWNSGMALNERSVKETIDAMARSGLRDAGYRYVNLDAGWAASTRGTGGELRADPDRFPHGMAELARYAHERGLSFGLYASPYNQTCGQDPRTASLGHEAVDAATFAAWGVDFLKYDWCRPDASHAEQVRVFTAMRDALRASGRPILYSINPNSSNELTAGSVHDWSGIADLVRTGADLVPLWRNVLPPLGVNDPLATGMFSGVPDQFVAATARPAGEGYVADPDMLVVGVTWDEFFTKHMATLRDSLANRDLSPALGADTGPLLSLPVDAMRWIATAQPGLTEMEQRSHFSLWAMLAAPLIAGNDLRSMSPITREILTNRDVIAVDQDPLLARATASRRDGRVWVKPLADGAAAVALFNPAGVPARIRTSAREAGLPPASCYRVRDLWTKTSATTKDEINASDVAPHEVIMLRITPNCSG
ncbi:glycoside hydrolase family 27 protein [Mycobacterium sp. MMS18-G62]